ncbi:MAG: hypothetical protein WC821_03000 [archaeon]|jgi:hypothetical protein
MNSIDAIIALCALIGCFGILIGVVNEQKQNSQEAINSINSKTSAIYCGSIVDSMFSNSASGFSGGLNCEASGNKVTATVAGKEKEYYTLTQTKKEPFLEVKILEHYK